MVFTYKPPQKLSTYNLVYACFSFEGYEPDLMIANSDFSEYSVTRMVPPGKIDYHFRFVNDGEDPFPIRFEDDIRRLNNVENR